MSNWITGRVTRITHHTDTLFSLHVQAPVLPFTAGQFAKLGLEIDGERTQRAYSYVNAPDDDDLEFYLVTVGDGKLSPRLAALTPGDELLITDEAAGFLCLMKCRTATPSGCSPPAPPSVRFYPFCNMARIWSGSVILCWCMPCAMPPI